MEGGAFAASKRIANNIKGVKWDACSGLDLGSYKQSSQTNLPRMCIWCFAKHMSGALRGRADSATPRSSEDAVAKTFAKVKQEPETFPERGVKRNAEEAVVSPKQKLNAPWRSHFDEIGFGVAVFAGMLGLNNFLRTCGFSALNHQKLVTFSRGADRNRDWFWGVVFCRVRG